MTVDWRGDDAPARYLGEPDETGRTGRFPLGRRLVWSLASAVAALALVAVWILAGLVAAVASLLTSTR